MLTMPDACDDQFLGQVSLGGPFVESSSQQYPSKKKVSNRAKLHASHNKCVNREENNVYGGDSSVYGSNNKAGSFVIWEK